MQYRILLAEDSPIIRSVVEDILKQEGFEVKTFSNEDEILREFYPFNPNIVLISTDLHSIDGYELCQKIKIINKDIPIILLAGAYEPFDEERAWIVGATEHILKPFEAYDLIGKIKKMLKIEGFESYESPYYNEDLETANLAEPPSNIESEIVESIIIEDRLSDLNDKTNSFLSIESKDEKPRISFVHKPTLTDIKNTEVSLQPHDKELANLLKQPLEDIFDYYLRTNLSEKLSYSMREITIEVLCQIATKMIDDMLKEKTATFISSLASDIEVEIKKALPAIIEKIIKERLERID